MGSRAERTDFRAWQPPEDRLCERRLGPPPLPIDEPAARADSAGSANRRWREGPSDAAAYPVAGPARARRAERSSAARGRHPSPCSTWNIGEGWGASPALWAAWRTLPVHCSRRRGRRRGQLGSGTAPVAGGRPAKGRRRGSWAGVSSAERRRWMARRPRQRLLRKDPAPGRPAPSERGPIVPYNQCACGDAGASPTQGPFPRGGITPSRVRLPRSPERAFHVEHRSRLGRAVWADVSHTGRGAGAPPRATRGRTRALCAWA
jgi:hypothetical protein